MYSDSVSVVCLSGSGYRYGVGCVRVAYHLVSVCAKVQGVVMACCLGEGGGVVVVGWRVFVYWWLCGGLWGGACVYGGCVVCGMWWELIIGGFIM